MPHLSAKKLKKDLRQKLYQEFNEALEKSVRKSSSKFFLQGFLTKTEKIMLSKRFAVICMLDKEVPVSYISESLMMSPATVRRMSLRHETGQYEMLLKTVRRQNKEIWNILEKILRAGLPPIAGRGRWKFLYENSQQSHSSQYSKIKKNKKLKEC